MGICLQTTVYLLWRWENNRFDFLCAWDLFCEDMTLKWGAWVIVRSTREAASGPKRSGSLRNHKVMPHCVPELSTKTGSTYQPLQRFTNYTLSYLLSSIIFLFLNVVQRARASIPGPVDTRARRPDQRADWRSGQAWASSREAFVLPLAPATPCCWHCSLWRVRRVSYFHTQNSKRIDFLINWSVDRTSKSYSIFISTLIFLMNIITYLFLFGIFYCIPICL